MASFSYVSYLLVFLIFCRYQAGAHQFLEAVPHSPQSSGLIYPQYFGDPAGHLDSAVLGTIREKLAFIYNALSWLSWDREVNIDKDESELAHVVDKLRDKARAEGIETKDPDYRLTADMVSALRGKGFEVRSILGSQVQGVALNVVGQDGSEWVAKVSSAEGVGSGVLAALKERPHSSIIEIRDFWKEGNLEFVITEKFGKNIRDISAAGIGTEKDALQCFSDIAEGVMHLFSVKVAHGDLHLGNVLYNNGHCKIIDFGSSSLSNPNPVEARQVIKSLKIVGSVPSTTFATFSSLLFDAPAKFRDAMEAEGLSVPEAMNTHWEIVFSGEGAPTQPTPVNMSVEQIRLLLQNEAALILDSRSYATADNVVKGSFPFYGALEDMKANCLAGRRAPFQEEDFETNAPETPLSWLTIGGKVFRPTWMYTEASSPDECSTELVEMLRLFDRDPKFFPPYAVLLLLKGYSAVTEALLRQGVSLHMLTVRDWTLQRIRPGFSV